MRGSLSRKKSQLIPLGELEDIFKMALACESGLTGDCLILKKTEAQKSRDFVILTSLKFSLKACTT
jgi:hypothetical protein